MYDPDLTPDSAGSGSYEEASWVSEFCSISGREIFLEVPEEFIEDDFNLTGLSHYVTYYREALEMILDLEPEEQMQLANVSLVENSAEILYGLIHARFLVSRGGIHSMARKYDYGVFGTCPRVLCNNMKLLPTGRHDIPGVENLRMFCPCCLDLYHPPSSRHAGIDGAYFGTSFVGLFLKTFPSVEQECMELRKKHFSLTIYGFKISEFSESGPRMKWLRRVPQNQSEIEEMERDTDGEEDANDEDDDDDSDLDDADNIEEDDDEEEEEQQVQQTKQKQDDMEDEEEEDDDQQEQLSESTSKTASSVASSKKSTKTQGPGANNARRQNVSRR